ncbi:hypothetical protein [Paenibacillus herberti]|uniref:Uncharacterized protein n=1 Tax=Paenibacillus herberti TaxID=1619309 RepID=A0A229P023_9BACL|nr:hypothetical protein [Paenibacillus herberti]OXM15606.1 hypothetical protein CGZ75_02410 [Paenibacillus herberti]
MTQQPQTKRSITTAVVFVLLTVSLIGNVLLFAMYLQNKQQDRVAEGKLIFQSWKETSDSLLKVKSTLDGLKDGSLNQDRVKILDFYELDEYGLESKPLLQIFEAAQQKSDNLSDWPKQYEAQATEFSAMLRKTLMAGTPAEQEQLSMLLQQLIEQISKVDTSVESRNRYLTLLADKTWPGAALEIARNIDAFKPSGS